MAYDKTVCFYFQVHQPLRLSKLNYFDLESKHDYFGGATAHKDHTNEFYVKKVGKKSYHPTNDLLLRLLEQYPEFRISFSISGIALEQFEKYDPSLIESFQKLVKTGRVELLNETYYHSLSSLYSKEEFAEQIRLHRRKIWKLFKRKPQIFRNTELIYNNELGNFIRKMGFKGVLAEGWDHILKGRSPNFIYTAPEFDLDEGAEEVISKYKLKERIPGKLNLLLKNYKLSDDIAFRFSNKGWEEHPLTVDKFVNWVKQAQGNTINLFMDYETFGEHQWEDSGIFTFLEKLPQALLSENIGFLTPSETIKAYDVYDEVDVHQLVSWADMERDVSAWLGNKMQREAAKQVFRQEPELKQVATKYKKSTREKLIDTWRKLQTSDHFYYMSTKYWNDGDIHKYFSPYDSPYDAYINYMNVLKDFKLEISKRSKL